MEATELARRARRAYELGRLSRALLAAPFVVLAAAVAVGCGRPFALTCALAAIALPLAVGLLARGGSAGRAVGPGLGAGWAALAPPLLLGTAGHACFGSACMSFCLPACALGGALGGVLIGRTFAHEGRLSSLVAAGALAGLVGAMGCSLGGSFGILGMIAGATAGAVPSLVLAR